MLADYDCYALWIDDDEGYRNIDPADEKIRLPRELIKDLNAWSAQYSATLNNEDPMSSGFENLEIEKGFVARGLGLARRVKHEVGPTWNVEYFNITKGVDVPVSGAEADAE